MNSRFHVFGLTLLMPRCVPFPLVQELFAQIRSGQPNFAANTRLWARVSPTGTLSEHTTGVYRRFTYAV